MSLTRWIWGALYEGDDNHLTQQEQFGRDLLHYAGGLIVGLGLGLIPVTLLFGATVAAQRHDNSRLGAALDVLSTLAGAVSGVALRAQWGRPLLIEPLLGWAWGATLFAVLVLAGCAYLRRRQEAE